MSDKQNKQSKQNTQTTATTAAPAQPAEAPTAQGVVATEVAPTEVTGSELSVSGGGTSASSESDADLISTSALLQKYAKALPDHANYLSQVAPPGKDEITDLTAALAPEDRARMVAAFGRMNPVKVGQHTAKREFNLPDIRIFHGTGTDEQRPGECPTGGIYTTDGRILAAPKEVLSTLRFNPKYANLREVFTGYVIGVHEAATFWPPRNAPAPEGVAVRNNVPICRSMDRQRGDYFGSCKSCAYQPFKDGKANKDACRSEDHLYIVPSDFSGIYRFVVSSTSIKTGSMAVKKKSKPWSSYYEQAFDFDARANSKGTNRWFELNANTSTAPNPTPEQMALLNALARQIDFQIYYPSLYRIYTTEPKMSTSQGTKADMDELMKNAGGNSGGAGGGTLSAPKRDFSNNNM